MDVTELDKEYDHSHIELEASEIWNTGDVYAYRPEKGGEVFSVDTPPPYVSASHLHVGHAMSYSQAEFIVRFKRMRGYNIFYPMGFDDNGLPTERYVENTYKVDKSKVTRHEFREMCIAETTKGAKVYEEFWRALGLSVDWRLRYSTIDDHCRRTAQASFLDLFEKGFLYRSSEPVLWDTHFSTSLAQADVENIERNGKIHEIEFRSVADEPLVIATTRPELIPACVALFCHPEDERYTSLIGTDAQVPLSDRRVPILTSEEVDAGFGTGLMMVCTFGDGEDVAKWRVHNLDTRIVINHHGRMTDLAGPYAGKTVEEARANIVGDLKAGGRLVGTTSRKQNVNVSERSGTPVEFVMAEQWFLNILDHKEALLAKSEELTWRPAHMKTRLEQWINGLKYNWNISRQRFYGVPFPVWFCQACGEPVMASRATLPVDPLETPCPAERCAKCGGTDFEGESDVMDTWMTSSLTPLINANWAGSDGRLGTMALRPMSVRVQAYEIIRTWLFYTLFKSYAHFDAIPWENVMISGWGLNEQGKKISKRDLEAHTTADGYNRYEPYALIRRFGADAVRYWAAGSHLGNDLRFNERDIRAGRKLVVKLWNVARLCLMNLKDFDETAPRLPVAERSPEDRWMFAEMTKALAVATDGFESYDYARAREAMERFFWGTYCDNYLEMVKHVFWRPESYSAAQRHAVQSSLYESLRALLGLMAPFLPFVTEGLYQRIYRGAEKTVSLHLTAWPKPIADFDADAEIPEMELVLGLLHGVRSLRTKYGITQTAHLATVTIDVGAASDETKERIARIEPIIIAVSRADEIVYAVADGIDAVLGLRLDIRAQEKPATEG
jgi:valyl-tRNA synthetase